MSVFISYAPVRLSATLAVKHGYVRVGARALYWRVNDGRNPRCRLFTERHGYRRVLFQVGRFVFGYQPDAKAEARSRVEHRNARLMARLQTRAARNAARAAPRGTANPGGSIRWER